MTLNNQPIDKVLELLKQINMTNDAVLKKALLEKFKKKFPENLDWLDMISEENSKQQEQGKEPFNNHLPDIEGFSLERVLGSGASGKVFSAIDLSTNKKVAIKVPMQFLTKDQMRRFQHESLLLSRLSHKNIARIHDVGLIENEQLPFISMEYVDGLKINNYCQQQGFNHRQIITLFKQVLDAVQYAHNQGVVHRDIKPDNILVDKEGIVKLLDFGIAMVTDNSTQQLTQLTKTGEIVGTLAYMSPEQVSGQNSQDTRTDVYSLGVVLYQLLSSSLPHKLDANQIFSAISQIIEDLPIKLKTQNNKVDLDLATIVHHAIEKNPDQRYQSPRDFKNDLDNWVDGNAITVKHNTLWHSVKYIAKKHKTLVAGSALAIVGLVTGLIFAISFALKEQQAREIAETSAKTSKKTVEFINELFASADPENAYGEKLTLLQVVDSADVALTGQMQGEEVVEANIRNTLANVFTSIGQYEKAQKQIDKVKQLLGNLDDLKSNRELKYHLVLNQIGINTYKNKYKENIEFIKQELGEGNFLEQEKLAIKTELANSLLSDGSLTEADMTIDKVLEEYQFLDLDNDSNELYAQVTKAMVLDKMGKFKESKTIYEKVKTRRLETVGIKHPKTLTLLNNLATVERNLGNTDKAIELLNQIVAIKKEVLGEAHLSTLVSQSNLLVIMIEDGQLQEADVFSLQLTNNLKQSLGALHPRTLEVKSMRAYLLEDLGKLEEAELNYKETLVQYDKAGTVSGTGLALLQNNLAMLLMKQAKFKESKTMFLDLIDNIDNSLGKEHVYFAIFIGNYGELLIKMKKFDEARPLLKQSLEKLTATFGETHQRTVKAKERLDLLPKNE